VFLETCVLAIQTRCVWKLYVVIKRFLIPVSDWKAQANDGLGLITEDPCMI
jgi:hypothetical protein